MSIESNDRRLLRWFFSLVTFVAVVSISVNAGHDLRNHFYIAAIFNLVLALALRTILIMQLRNPNWPLHL